MAKLKEWRRTIERVKADNIYIQDNTGNIEYTGNKGLKTEILDLSIKLYLLSSLLSAVIGVFPCYLLISSRFWHWDLTLIEGVIFFITVIISVTLLSAVLYNIRVVYSYISQARMRHNFSTKVLKLYRKLAIRYAIAYIVITPIIMLFIATSIKLLIIL